MSVNRQNNYIGGALIPNTLICEVSRLFPEVDANEQAPPLLPWKKGIQLNSKRLSDLFSLIDATCLYEKLFTLPSKLTPDVKHLQLRQELIDRSVLEMLDTSETRPKIARIIVDSLGQLSQPTDSKYDPTKSFAPPAPFQPRAKNGFESFFLLASHDIPPWHPPSLPMALDTIEDNFSVYQLDDGGRSSDALNASSYEQLAQSLIWSMDYRSSGAYEDCTSILRDLYYISTSEVFSLPYRPQLDRIEFSKKFPNFITSDIRTKLYTLLAEGLKTAISEIDEDFNCGTVFIPPFAAIAMSRSSNVSELLQNIFEIRHEYTKLRQQLIDLEEQRLAAVSIKERRKIIKEHKRLLSEASKAFDKPRIISLEAVVRYIPEVIKPVTAPSDPTKYSSELLLQPIDWLITWWRLRPLSKLLHLADKVQDVKNYGQLATKVFGKRFFEET
jgi:hypothetical protein